MSINSIDHNDHSPEIKDKDPLDMISKKMNKSYIKKNSKEFFQEVDKLAEMLVWNKWLTPIQIFGKSNKASPLYHLLYDIDFKEHKKLAQYRVPILEHKIKSYAIVYDSYIQEMRLREKIDFDIVIWRTNKESQQEQKDGIEYFINNSNLRDSYFAIRICKTLLVQLWPHYEQPIDKT